MDPNSWEHTPLPVRPTASTKDAFHFRGGNSNVRVAIPRCYLSHSDTSHPLQTLVWWVSKCARLTGNHGQLTHFTASTLLTPEQLHHRMRLTVVTGPHPERSQINLSTRSLDFQPVSFYSASRSRTEMCP